MSRYERRPGGSFGGRLVPAEPTITWTKAFDLHLQAPPFNPTVPLETQLTNAFHLGEEFYATGSFTEEDTSLGTSPSQRRVQLGLFAIQALEAEYLHGRLGLAFISTDLFRHSLENQLHRRLNSVAYHGSPQSLDMVESRQATWVDALGRRYADGRMPTARASANTGLPTTRAILHESRPELADISLLLSKQVDRQGRTHWFTSEEALEAVKDVHGYVNVIDPNDNIGDAFPPYYDLRRNEYVITGNRQTLGRVRVDVNDMPSDICVVALADKEKIGDLRGYDNPRKFGDEIGIQIRPFGGMWTSEYYPK